MRLLSVHYGTINQIYSANTTKAYARVSGWKTVSINISYATFKVNEAEKLCILNYVRDFSAADADKFYTWHTGAIPSQYRPAMQFNGSMNQVGTLYVDSTGEIGGKFANAWSSNRTVKGTVMWHY